jgi:3D (Asp-Asp-Asp) domain-containing protein
MTLKYPFARYAASMLILYFVTILIASLVITWVLTEEPKTEPVQQALVQQVQVPAPEEPDLPEALPLVVKAPSRQYLPVWALTTAYSPDAASCYPFDDGKTSIGVCTKRDPWGIAVDPSIIPYGTEIIVPGYSPSRYYDEWHPWKADDTGSAMRRSARRGILHLDLRYIHHRSAVNYGTKWKVVYICLEGLSDPQKESLRRFEAASDPVGE